MWLTWFARIMWLGIAANVALALFGVVDPAEVLALLALEPAQPLLWPRFAGFLLLLLTVFYVPGALDPLRNRFAAAFAVVCRFGGAGFFALAGGGYLLLGLYDLLFGVPLAVLLVLGYMRERQSA